MKTKENKSTADRLLSPEEIEGMVRGTPGWTLEGNAMTREFQFGNFRQAIDFVNKVAERAEELDHHPDICIFYNKVNLSLSTHKVGGLSHADFTLATRINTLTNS